MKMFVRRLIQLLIPLILECLDEVLNPERIKEGQRSENSKKAAQK